MNIAVLGASFDPSHNGHLAIAKNVLKSQKIHKVILMPVNMHPFGKRLTPAHHRLSMAKLLEEPHFAKASRGKKNIEVSDLEINKRSKSYSIETLKLLQKHFPQDNLYWIIGSDNLESFTKWKDWQKIITDFGLIVVARNNHADISEELGEIIKSRDLNKNIIILPAKDFPPFDISSSEIRERVKEGKSIKNLVPKEVENYIIENKLYA